jgi:hypothetical protein
MLSGSLATSRRPPSARRLADVAAAKRIIVAQLALA